MTTWLTPLRGKCNTLKNPSGGAERSIIQKALLGPHWPRCHNSSRTQMKIQLVLCKLLNMVQSLQSCFCVCVCVCDFLKNKDFMPFEHAISLYSVLHNLLSLLNRSGLSVWQKQDFMSWMSNSEHGKCCISCLLGILINLMGLFMELSQSLKSFYMPYWDGECF